MSDAMQQVWHNGIINHENKVDDGIWRKKKML